MFTVLLTVGGLAVMSLVARVFGPAGIIVALALLACAAFGVFS